MLLIPGAGNATTLRGGPEILAWVRDVHQTTTWTTSVCTGSLILGAAGLLKNLRATTHWAALDRLQIWEADPVHERIVEDGKVMTAAGVSAGIHMALTLAAKLFRPQYRPIVATWHRIRSQSPFDEVRRRRLSQQSLRPCTPA